jgi:hypothetical protein
MARLPERSQAAVRRMYAAAGPAAAGMLAHMQPGAAAGAQAGGAQPGCAHAQAAGGQGVPHPGAPAAAASGTVGSGAAPVGLPQVRNLHTRLVPLMRLKERSVL